LKSVIDGGVKIEVKKNVVYSKEVQDKAKILNELFPTNSLEFYLEYVNQVKSKPIDELISDYLALNCK